MIGLGTIINCAAIVSGGVIGLIGGKWLNERCQETIVRSMGICVLTPLLLKEGQYSLQRCFYVTELSG